MDIGRVLARALEIGWRYKVLWVFGFIMALTGGGGATGTGYRANRVPVAPLTPGRPFRIPVLEPRVLAVILALLACLLILWLVLTLYFRFVARGALVASVRAIENGTAPKLGSAWRDGQRYYWRLLGLGFVVNVPLWLFSVVVIALAILPFLGTLAVIANQATGGAPSGGEVLPVISGIIALVALVFCAVLCLAFVHLVVHPIYEFAVRSIVLENTGTIEGLSRGYGRMRTNLGQASMLYLILIIARIGWGLALLFVEIPIVLVIVAIILGVVSTSVGAAVLIGIVVGLPALVVFSFLDGLFQVFEANAWTEAYLSLMAPADLGSGPTGTQPTVV